MNNCLNCRYHRAAIVDLVNGHWCGYSKGFKKIKFPFFKGGSKRCECYLPWKTKPEFLKEYPKKEEQENKKEGCENK